ncbi:DUF448 domain-containing protein [Porphyrobacter sp. GA68]|uniref:DUF448 domain-containing protein n=1 Tax=Porphyrobacter sp. GA68 TaxID=2883480 RepID=UPI001D18990E|nr:DUF448 domain-containing protein [Porphyrobacter sp. GA68]
MRTPPNERLTPATAEPADAFSGAPERRCILTRQSRGRDELTRLAVASDGLVLPDVQARAPGRGAWIGVDRPTLEKAIRDGTLKRALAHAFKSGALRVPEDLPERIDRALQKLLLDRLGLELRAGHLLLGSQRIDKAAREGRVTYLFHAADASADGAAKLDQAWRVGTDAEGSGKTGTRLPLDRNALSVAMGRENVVHLALTDEGAGRRVGAIAGRWSAYKGTAIAATGRQSGADPAEPTGLAGTDFVKD